MGRNAILCVDDEAIIVMALLQELKMNLGDRYVYESAVNAAAALTMVEDLLQEGITVSLVISDWLMPGMKGDEFLLRVRRMYPAVQTIMITGQADDEAIERVKIEAGACAVFRKPWDTGELIRTIEFCIGNIDCPDSVEAG